ncbi:hypothetical protein E2562_014132 [Oryza meyeriana var. granulata]|uniref:Uncharacterized protein n=1 Tax=Oryza meyeriana var. granulata TaxID=110450 RepID=A0A6G1F8L0_9ORYZ|nr:hypothetical protein E2562_014132 [Oryza meyeriana var. granulata]
MGFGTCAPAAGREVWRGGEIFLAAASCVPCGHLTKRIPGRERRARDGARKTIDPIGRARGSGERASAWAVLARKADKWWFWPKRLA